MYFGDPVEYNKVYIIILNWNGTDDTIECLKSVYSVNYNNYVVIVIDNGSVNSPANKIKDLFPDTIIIENKINLGFAEGNNIGIRHALKHGADYIFLLNNDTVVEPDILKELVSASRRNGDAGIFGAEILYYSEPDKIWYAGAKWDSYSGGFYHIIDSTHSDVVETDYACGCAFFISVKVINIIGLLEPRFFLTFEETDMCYRAKRFGYKSYYVPRAKVWHKISASFGGSTSPLITYYLTRNILFWSERNQNTLNHLKLIYKIFRKLLLLNSTDHGHVLMRNKAVRVAYCLTRLEFGKYRSVESRSFYYGFRDYILRRFGDCSDEVRSLIFNN